MMVCASQHSAASMLLCDGCDRGFHMQCIGMRQRRPPDGGSLVLLDLPSTLS
jgi:hypothetical protein